MNLKKALVLFIIISGFHTVNAQETIITDISYPFLEKLVAVAKENYPRMKYFQGRTQAAKYVLNRQQVSWLNPLTLSYLYQPNTTVNLANPTIFSGFQFGVFLNVGSLLGTPSVIKQAKEEMKVAQSEYDEYNLNIEALVKERYFTYIQKVSSLKLRSRSVLDAESMLKGIKYRYEKSEVSYDDYSKALFTLTEQNQSKLIAESEMLIAKASLEELLSKKLEDIK